jgi:membrane protein implicated in regulation of membrane protease activity
MLAGSGWSAAEEAGGVRMGIGLALVAVGALMAFAMTGELLGVDTDVLGVLLIVAGVVVAVLAAARTRRRGRPGSSGRP